MSIVEVVDHLYHIERNQDGVTIHFRTSRTPSFVALFSVPGLFVGALWTAVHFGWSGTIIAGLIGASVSFTGMTCFAVAEDITWYTIRIESDVVRFQRDFAGIPVGARKIYPRAAVTDLGIYPRIFRGDSRPLPPVGRLCVWINGKSLEIESYFLISEGVALASDLRALGISFPRTHDVYDEDLLRFVDDFAYFSF